MKNLNGFCCFLVVAFVFGCGSQKSVVELLNETKETPKTLVISNSLLVNNEAGHIQGVQFFEYKKNGYYFFTGSSNDQSYYAVADAETTKMISVNALLGGDFRHAGGFQIAGDLLAVGIEDNIKVDRSKVQIFKIIDPFKPTLKLLKTIERQGAEKRFTAGCVAILKHKNNIIVAVGNWDTKNIDFYSISSKNLENKEVKFNLFYSLDTENMDSKNWVEPSWNPYQSINFISASKDDLYLLGTTGNDSLQVDFVDLFKVDMSNWERVELQKVGYRKFSKKEGTNMKWGGGVYWDRRKGLSLFSSGRNIGDSLVVEVFK